MDYITKDELIKRTKYILSISGLFDDLRYSNSKIDTISNMIVNRCNKNYTKEVIEENILAVLKDMKSESFNVNIDDINIIPLFTKLILEDDKSNYMSLIKGYTTYFNEINYYQDTNYLKFINELKNASSITVFSTLKNKSYNFLYCFHFLGHYPSSYYKHYKIRREYFSNGNNVVEDLIVMLNLDKLIALQEAQKLNMDEVYYMDEFEEGFINNKTGIINPYKNPYVIRENNTIRLLEGYTLANLNTEFDSSSYEVGFITDNDNPSYIKLDSISKYHEDNLLKIKNKMIKKLEEDIINGMKSIYEK
jgi:hypothetical protein